MDTPNPSRDFPGEYRLDVEDFGPIAKASVDLRPLTVFIGPSNTGKSYLAILVYALHRSLGDGVLADFGSRSRYRRALLGPLLRKLRDGDEHTSRMLDEFRYWVLYAIDKRISGVPLPGLDWDGRSGFAQGEQKLNPKIEFPDVASAHIRSVFDRSEGFDTTAENEIGRCFGVEGMGPLVRRTSHSSRAKVEVSVPRHATTGVTKYMMELSGEGAVLRGSIEGSESLSKEVEGLDIDELSASYTGQLSLFSPGGILPGYQVEELCFLLAGVAENVLNSLLVPLHRNTYYLPADRTGVMHSHQVVVGALVRNAATAGLRPFAGIPLLSGVLADFLTQLIEIGGEQGRSHSKRPASTSDLSELLALDLEHTVLKGAIQVEDTGSSYPRFDFEPRGWSDPLPLMRASSMVSELAPVVLYLRHLVQPGDVLIIEEPESHLHPAMQVEFTRQLAGLVRAGIRVIVTTHSEWVLQELANLVRVSKLPEAKRAGIAGGDVALEPDQVGAWLFKPDATGESSTVNEIPLDDESGLYPTDFDDVAVAMHNDWAEIFSRLGEDE